MELTTALAIRALKKAAKAKAQGKSNVEALAVGLHSVTGVKTATLVKVIDQAIEWSPIVYDETKKLVEIMKEKKARSQS